MGVKNGGRDHSFAKRPVCVGQAKGTQQPGYNRRGRGQVTCVPPGWGRGLKHKQLPVFPTLVLLGTNKRSVVGD